LVMLGDSMVADFASNDYRFAGWGQGIYSNMMSNVRVANLSEPYQSTLTFLYSIQKDNLLAIQPDFVLIQFGWVDAGPTLGFHTDIADYEANLKTIVQMIRDFKGTPILVTPPNPRWFDLTGKIIPAMQIRTDVVRNVAAEMQTYLIDLDQLLTNLYNELGPSESIAEIASNPDDGAHFSPQGADIIARLVVDAFPGILRSQVLRH
ncbi:MAG: GDSL-type esterase/lipase family protein, partial [Verrucomicrobiota bacterium]